MSSVCPACGQINPPGALACGACGARLPTTSPVAGATRARSVFVGRERELATLRTQSEAAAAGQGGLVLLVGEAGIGKTHTAREFAREARQRGATVLWGSCYEGESQPPFGPWVAALNEYARRPDSQALRQQVGASASVLAQLVPALRVAFPDTPPVAPLDPDAERYRLYDAVGQWLLAAASAQPLVLLLDDLHWADRDSLALLRYVARLLEQARLLVVGAYRDPDLALHQSTALLDTLGQLRRESPCLALALGGLGYPAVAAYLAQASGQEWPPALAEAVYAQTDGNPFFTGELMRHLVEEGRLDRLAASGAPAAALGVPAGVRQVLARRLAQLSLETTRLLRLAAACPGGFSFLVLQALTDLADERLLDALDEALQAGLIRASEERDAPYDFAHALIRHTLYDELNPDRKARLHRQIAEALRHVYAEREAEHAAEIAEQYHASARLPGAEQGIPYCLAAAEAARQGTARERAVSFLRLARDLAAQAAPALRAEVLGKLALAEAEALQLAAAEQTVEQALAALAEVGVAPAARAQFLATVARALKDGGARATVWQPLIERGLALPCTRSTPRSRRNRPPRAGWT